jgi:hypothetical protein
LERGKRRKEGLSPLLNTLLSQARYQRERKLEGGGFAPSLTYSPFPSKISKGRG